MNKVVRGKASSSSFGNGKPDRPQSWTESFWQIFLTLISFVWFLAVIKVFLLSNQGELHRHHHDKPQMVVTSKVNNAGVSLIQAVETYHAPNPKVLLPPLSEKARQLNIPSPNEWELIRADPKYTNPVVGLKSRHAMVVSGIQSNSLSADAQALANKDMKPATELTWPPLLDDGSIPPGEGSDLMPMTLMKVPRFWEPPKDQDLFKTGTYVNGQETIFLMIASYRDFQCRETITSAFRRADHPERLYIGAVDQIVPGDTGCLDLEIPCSQDPTQMICVYRSQISVYKMDGAYATGPVTARHIGDRMYRGQYFVMQMDAHCLFINHWDSMIIDQWRMTHNEMAVLTSYLTDVQGSISPAGDSLRNSRPIMCNSDYEGIMPARYLRHGSQPEDVAAIRNMPQLEPFWAAGFSFSRGHFKVQVPYDGFQPMVFQGEEIAIGIRGFTYGYDFYAPRDSVVFHEYAEKSNRRKKVHMFWENSETHKGEGQKSLRRATAIVGMAPGLDPSTYDHTDEQRYGLGKERPLSEFYRLFLINAEARKATQLCPFVRGGKMHREFQKYLRPNGMGIDYSFLKDFDTAAILGVKGGTKKLDVWDTVKR